MFTLKATLYFSMAVALLVLGLVLEDFQIGILVLGLASLFFVTNLWGLPERVEIKLTREVSPKETFGNEDITIVAHVQNMENASLRNLEILEALPSPIVPEKGTNRIQASLGALAEVEFGFEFPSPPRANYQIGPLIVRARDPFGLYLVERNLAPETFSVIPRPERIRGVQLRPRRVGPWPGPIPSRVLGLGTEFYSLREYVPGDDPKRINWKVSARHNELIINETEAERVTDVMVVLDTDVTFFGPNEAELFERGVEAAASMASFLLRQGNRVGLVLQGGERGSIPAGFGKRHERRLLYLLAAARPGRASVSTSYVMNLLASRMLPSRAQVVVISPLLDPEIKEGVRQLVAKGYSLLVISPTPTPPSTFMLETERLAFELIMLDRSITLLALEKSSTVVNWPKEIPLTALMSKVRRQRRMVMA